VIGVFGGELLKLRKRPAVWVLVAILLAVLVFLSYVLLYAVLVNPPRNFSTPGTTPLQLRRQLYPAGFVRVVLNSISGPGAAVVLILGVLSTGGEYGWGTLKTLLTQRPGRLSTLTGKLLALAVTTVIIVILLFAGGAATSAILARLDGAEILWPASGDILRGMGAACLILAMWIALGLVLAVAFRQTALPVGVGLVYMLVIEGLILGIFGQAEGLREVARALPGSNATALIASFRLPAGAGAFQQRGPLVGAGQAALVLTAYTLVFLLVSGVLMRRRDVT